jgi:hypothetical protein
MNEASLLRKSLAALACNTPAIEERILAESARHGHSPGRWPSVFLAERQPTRRFAAGEIVAALIGLLGGKAACEAAALSA